MSHSKKEYFDGTEYEQLTLFALPVVGDKIAVSCFDGQQIKVKDLEPWMVKLVPDGECTVDIGTHPMVLKKVPIKESEIQEGHQFYHFLIGGKVYAGIFVGRYDDDNEDAELEETN